MARKVRMAHPTQALKLAAGGCAVRTVYTPAVSKMRNQCLVHNHRLNQTGVIQCVQY